jgi:G3E family GTPase
VGWAFTRPQLEGRFRLDALVTVADCLNLEAAADGSPEGRRQLERADLLLMSKTDLADPAREAAVRERLTALNSEAKIFRNADPAGMELLLETELRGDFAAVASSASGQIHNHHGFQSLAIAVGERRADRDALEDFLEGLPPAVYRSKGIVRVTGEEEWLVFHSVASRLDVDFLANHDGPGALVFIGKGLDREGLTRDVDALFGMGSATE